MIQPLHKNMIDKKRLAITIIGPTLIGSIVGWVALDVISQMNTDVCYFDRVTHESLTKKCLDTINMIKIFILIIPFVSGGFGVLVVRHYVGPVKHCPHPKA